MKRVLYIVGLVRNWAIANRARMLQAKLANDVEIDIAAKGQLPRDPREYDIIHLQTPCMIPEIAEITEYFDHPAWGFEVISTRSNAHLRTYADVVRKARFCVCKNPRLIEQVRPYVNCEPMYLPNGVDERLFFPRDIRIGWCGNKRDDSMEYKGVALIREAVDKLRAENKNWAKIEFVMDPGDAPKRVLAQAEIAPWYRTLDVYATASLGEGCSNTVLEALASGVPVVTTDTGIAPELAKECDVRIVEQRTPDAIATALRAILGPKLASRRAICQKYRWKKLAADYAALYRSLL